MPSLPTDVLLASSLDLIKFRYLLLTKMENIYVIDPEKIKQITKLCLDKIVPLCEAASELLTAEQCTANRNLAKLVLTKLYEGDMSKSCGLNNLRQLLCDVLLNIVYECQTEKNPFDTLEDMQDQLEKKLSRKIKTFNKEIRCELSKEGNILKKVISKHTDVVRDVQKTQEKYWNTQGKFENVHQMLHEYRQTLPFDEMTINNKTIRSLVESMKSYSPKTAEIFQKLKTFKNTEATVRNELETTYDNYIQPVSQKIAERLRTALETLKKTTENMIHNIYRRNDLLRQIEDFDVENTTKTLIAAGSWIYLYPKSLPYIDENCAPAKISHPIKVKTAPKAIDPNDAVDDYIELMPNTAYCGQQFLNVQKGSLVKRKASSKKCSVQFGWTRKFPWQKKTWGFFKTDDIAYN